MAKDFFNNLDLNLLRIFLVIYQEKNLKKASVRLHVSAPALSKSLNRLRHHFDDPLFLKVPKGLSPTPFSDNLAEKITPTFDTLNNNIKSLQEFTPSDLSGKLTIAVSPFLLHAIGKDLFTEIHQQAPNIELHLVNWSKSSLDEISVGTSKLGINYDLPLSRKDIVCQFIIKDQFRVYVRKEHPVQGDEIEFTEAKNYPIATLIAADWNLKESFAEKIIREVDITLEPNIVFRSELPSAILDTISETNILFPSTGYIHIERYPNLRALSVVDTEQLLLKDIQVYYPTKDRNDPTQQWLLRIITQILKDWNK
ncbi:LysR family transcriptional regulator [Vibrio rarus]|uniref:LysR family transcriptional regulator n=1 Tax=Vibrio rarus TaxID=413403 RepID=UPI0021C336AC|nr:LysR family transcriptional regulator [Vibrio rarus]